MQVCTLLQTDNHASTLPLCFLQAGYPSCRPTNSVKALKAAKKIKIVEVEETKKKTKRKKLKKEFKFKFLTICVKIAVWIELVFGTEAALMHHLPC